MTSDDLHSIRYFWEEKGDPTRWVGWERTKPDLLKEHPQILWAWENYLETRRCLTEKIRSAISNSEED